MSNPFARHQREFEDAARATEQRGYRRAYEVLGDDLAEYVGDDLSLIPVLSYPETAPVVAEQVPLSAALVLDAGCGPNPQVSIRLARPGRCIVALDIGWSTVDLARRVGATQAAELRGVVGDLEHLPFRSGSVDAVVCDDTIEHVPDDRRAVAELAAVLRPHGLAVLATPNRRSLAVIVRKARDRARGNRRPATAYYAAASHLREYAPAEFRRLVGRDFAVRRSAVVGWSADRMTGRIANGLVRVMPRLSRMNVLVATPLRAP
jgi:2-polyprenyl-3-methyl-5-hydroxy-6-metoxy-1,4-benzoquinol methylase